MTTPVLFGTVADVLLFLLLPWLVWRLLRRSIPLAVLPILMGLCLAAFGWLPPGIGVPSGPGHWFGFVGVLVMTFAAGMEIHRPHADATDATQRHELSLPRLASSAFTALALPFAVGSVAAFYYFMQLEGWVPAQGQGWLGAMAIGLCIAVSALPVLVGIVRELAPADRFLGQLALRVAVIDDAVLWIGIALLVFVANGQSQISAWGATQFIAIGVLAALALQGVVARRWPAPANWMIWIAAPLLLMAGSWASSHLGLHELLGAYFAGAMMAPRWVNKLPVERIGLVALFGMAPLFFGHSGLRIQGDALSLSVLIASAGLLVIAVSTKLTAVVMHPPVRRLPFRDTLAVGALLQCKGLMEIVAATILLDQGLISQRAFAALVTLAVLSTTLTGPLFRAFRGRKHATMADALHQNTDAQRAAST